MIVIDALFLMLLVLIVLYIFNCLIGIAMLGLEEWVDVLSHGIWIALAIAFPIWIVIIAAATCKGAP